MTDRTAPRRPDNRRPNNRRPDIRRPDIRRQALHAAASVALAFSAGCAGGKPSASPAAPGPTAETPPDAGVASTPPAADGPGADALPVCKDLERDARYACCETLRTACYEKFTDNADGKAAECVFGPDLNGSTGCTPWGPPVPPAMA